MWQPFLDLNCFTKCEPEHRNLRESDSAELASETKQSGESCSETTGNKSRGPLEL